MGLKTPKRRPLIDVSFTNRWRQLTSVVLVFLVPFWRKAFEEIRRYANEARFQIHRLFDVILSAGSKWLIAKHNHFPPPKMIVICIAYFVISCMFQITYYSVYPIQYLTTNLLRGALCRWYITHIMIQKIENGAYTSMIINQSIRIYRRV